jgi:hypothetical protein
LFHFVVPLLLSAVLVFPTNVPLTTRAAAAALTVAHVRRLQRRRCDIAIAM